VNQYPVRVRLPGDRELVSHGLRGMLASHRDRIAIVEPGDPGPADVEIIDASGPAPDGIGGLTGADVGGRRCLVLVDDDVSPRLVRRALDLGAVGVMLTSEPADALADALVRAAVGSVVLSAPLAPNVSAGAQRWPGEDRGLSRRESQVLVLISGGRSPEDITRALGIAHETVRSHLKRVYHKLGVRDRAGAVARAWSEGIVDRLTVAELAVSGPRGQRPLRSDG
jgi:DNA-binding NarL/FixJ family response regulator